MGDSQFGLNIKTITYIANEIKEVSTKIIIKFV